MKVQPFERERVDLGVVADGVWRHRCGAVGVVLGPEARAQSWEDVVERPGGDGEIGDAVSGRRVQHCACVPPEAILHRRQIGLREGHN